MTREKDSRVVRKANGSARDLVRKQRDVNAELVLSSLRAQEADFRGVPRAA